jgi:hypothetical protein
MPQMGMTEEGLMRRIEIHDTIAWAADSAVRVLRHRIAPIIGARLITLGRRLADVHGVDPTHNTTRTRGTRLSPGLYGLRHEFYGYRIALVTRDGRWLMIDRCKSDGTPVVEDWTNGWAYEPGHPANAAWTWRSVAVDDVRPMVEVS